MFLLTLGILFIKGQATIPIKPLFSAKDHCLKISESSVRQNAIVKKNYIDGWKRTTTH